MTTAQQKVALITGSGKRRVGNSVAAALAGRGYSIAVHFHRSAEEAERTVAELNERGADAAAFQADMAVEADVERLFNQAAERFGRLDVLVTAAALWEPRPLEEVTAADVRRQFDVNTLGTFLCCRRAGLLMAEQPEGGAIVTVGDWATQRPYADYSAYFVSKGAIPTITRTMAVELARRNPKVRVNCILPGPVMLPDDLSRGPWPVHWLGEPVVRKTWPRRCCSSWRTISSPAFACRSTAAGASAAGDRGSPIGGTRYLAV